MCCITTPLPLEIPAGEDTVPFNLPLDELVVKRLAKVYLSPESPKTDISLRVKDSFGIDFVGDRDETRQTDIQHNLQIIKEINPKLLEHVKRIILYTSEVDVHRLGLALPGDTIALFTTDYYILVHELAHVMYAHAPAEFHERQAMLFDGFYGKNLSQVEVKDGVTIFPTTWLDGSIDPRQGFVEPYGANNANENVATYVARAHNLYFWNHPAIELGRGYIPMLFLLKNFDFITQIQFDDIVNLMRDKYTRKNRH